MKNFSFKQLTVFVLVARLGSLSAAAEACYMTQAAASLSLKELEKQLDVVLFDRIGKRLQLSSVGEQLLPQAIRLLDQAENFCEQLQPTEPEGVVELAVSTTIGNFILPELLAEFNSAYPKISCRVSILNTEKVIAKAQQLAIDFGLIEGKCYANELLLEPWRDDELIIIANRNHPLTKNKRCSLTTLSQYPWVMREADSGTQKIFLAAIGEQTNLPVKMILNSSQAIKQYVMHSDCLACVSKAAVQQELQTKQLIEIKVTKLKLNRDLLLIKHKEKFQSYACQLLIQFLFE